MLYWRTLLDEEVLETKRDKNHLESVLAKFKRKTTLDTLEAMDLLQNQINYLQERINKLDQRLLKS